MPRARVLFPFAGDYPIGGSHISALGLIQSLDRSRFDPVIVLQGTPGEPADLFREAGLEFDMLEGAPMMSSRRNRHPDSASPLTYVTASLWRMRDYVRRADIDIVHTNDGQVHVNWGLAAKAARRRLLWHHRQDPAAFGVNRIAPLIADRILSVSRFACPVRPIRSVDGLIRVVRSPFDLSSPCPDKPAARATLGREIEAGEEDILIGYFGGLIDRKRPLHFVRAIRAIQDALPDLSVHGLIFGGVAPTAPGLDERITALAAELGLSPNIRLMGFRQPIAGYMAGVDATLVTAVNEPFGRTLIEAMHLRTPVIATRHGGNVEAIEDGQTGFLVDPGDPAAFAAPVARLIRDPGLRERITREAEAHVHSTFSVERHVREVSAVYDELLPEAA